MKSYYVYIMASKQNGTLYIGVTNDLLRRVNEHKAHTVGGFTDKYNVTNLVYYDITESVQAAISREKQLKQWKRDWKIALIEKENPTWKDLAVELF